MKDEHHPHGNHHAHTHNDHTEKDVVEQFKEEGMLTIETLNVASHDAQGDTHHKVHAKKRFLLTTPAAIVLGSVIIALGIVAYGFIVRDGSQGASQAAVFSGKVVDDADYVEGKVKSDIIVVEYSDPECPFCVQLHPAMKQLRTEYEDRVAFVYRHFPLTQIHPHAFDESKAIVCAGKLGGTKKYYEYIDSLFGYKITNKTTQLPQTGKEDIARNVGLDIAAFSTCMKDEKTGEVVTSSLNDGIAAGVQGTPTTFILKKIRKGYEVISIADGARPYSYLKAAVDEALSK